MTARRKWTLVVAFWVLCAGIGWTLGEEHPEMSGGAPTGATVYEDGSWVAPDGATGCLDGGLCAD